MKGDASATQPPADELIDHIALVDALRLLARRPGVYLQSIGTSVEGRDIPMVIITDTDDPSALRAYQDHARRLAMPSLKGRGIGAFELEAPTADVTQVRAPVLFVGGSFGDEAAHVEALLDLAERLEGDPMLDSLLFLVVPLINPDGRERAIAEWRTNPRSSGSAGEGNAHGQILNRDFLYVSQPESRAISAVLEAWDPIVVWDAHEDAISLARHHREVCLAPPTGPEPPPGIDLLLDRRCNEIGTAIATAWRGAGFDVLHDAHGGHGWTAPQDGLPSRMTGFLGRLVYAAGLRGVPAFITESARVWGAQSWGDRIEQKLLAGLTTARYVREHKSVIVRDVVAARVRATEENRERFFVLAADQDESVLAEGLRILGAHGVDMYAGRGAIVVPAGQPIGLAVLALMGEFAPHDGLTQSIGLRVIPSDQMDAEELQEWRSADLTRVTPGGARTGSIKGNGWSRHTRQAPPVAEAAVVDPKGNDGAHDFPRPPVGIYAGAGVTLRQGSSLGSARWLLNRSGLQYTEIDTVGLAEGALVGLEVLLVPSGDARIMMNGWPAEDTWYGPPWTPPLAADVLSAAGAHEIRRFVEGGGTYIGLDAGGGWLATTDFLGLIPARRIASGLGLAAVDLQITTPESPIFTGTNGSWALDGTWRERVLYAPYGGEGNRGADSAFATGPNVTPLAVYGKAHSIPGIPHLVDGSQLMGAAAIIEGRLGAGRVLLFGFDPAFRCYWMSTHRLLINAVGATKAHVGTHGS